MMKRMHIHVGVEDVEQAVRFYTSLFGAEPAKIKPDYAKWMLEDPRINFAISTRVGHGLDHLGLQVDEAHELEALRSRFRAADMAVFDEGEAACCYARSEKTWLKDPAGIGWEAFLTMEDVQLFSARREGTEAACCTPAGDESREACC